MKYDEININIGCPSPKVQEGSFGACLMKTPDVVAEFTKEISETVKIPVTVKCRLGVDDFDNYEFIKTFVDTVGAKGNVKHFVVHARKAFLKVDFDKKISIIFLRNALKIKYATQRKGKIN